MPIHSIYDPIYQNKIHFIFDTPKDKAIAYMKKQGIDPLNFDEHWKKAGVMYGDDGDGDYFIILPDKKTDWTITTILAHEAFHATCKVMRSKGVELSPESEEAYNYYITWILQRFTDFYNQHRNKKVKPMKAKAPKKAVSKAEFKKYVEKDKKDDMKMIKAAMKKSDKMSSGKRK